MEHKKLFITKETIDTIEIHITSIGGKSSKQMKLIQQLQKSRKKLIAFSYEPPSVARMMFAINGNVTLKPAK